ncbi:hypothetical protein JZ751_010713 [Albula glossodonta]|uniref:Brain-specific angiogenesis inhibitor 1-associated protein 2-like protein 1 n=1 Tax=Albula glossodonta TaxID=121402 RepID=A0A8T2MZQ2_9TELE|nr:hypothetical protein JZ751_010713 [Albula glossodonta]
MEISEVNKKIHLELEENFKRFHKEIIAELERKTDMDVKYMNATFKRYQTEHKLKQDSLERSQSDLKKLRRKSQGKNATKYESKENECMETITSRQMDIQKFIADGCREALLEEKRRFCFLVDKHCTFSYQISTFHEKAKEMLAVKLPGWQDQCSDATKVPDSVLSMIEGLRTPVSMTPQPSPLMERYNRNNLDMMIAPPAPQQKAQTSPLANMFTQDSPRTSMAVDRGSDHSSTEENSLPRSVSVATGLNMIKRPKVRTIFPHNAGSNDTLLSFDEGDIITLLIPEEKDGWLYGEMEKSRQRGWFPSSYCRPYTDLVVKNSLAAQVRSLSMANLAEQEQEAVVLPPPDYCDNTSIRITTSKTSKPSPESTHSERQRAHVSDGSVDLGGLVRRQRAGSLASRYGSARPPSGRVKYSCLWPVLARGLPVARLQHKSLCRHGTSGVSLSLSDRVSLRAEPETCPTPPRWGRALAALHPCTGAVLRVTQPNGTSKPPFLGGGNPFATVKLRPTVTNDRSAPII